jgi:hypothetical protein
MQKEVILKDKQVKIRKPFVFIVWFITLLWFIFALPKKQINWIFFLYKTTLFIFIYIFSLFSITFYYYYLSASYEI